MSEFILYRILGNDLPPCHGLGQTLSNLQFILEHEPSLAGCEKRWVVNRIVDSAQEAKILALLDKYGQKYLHLPFLLEEYSQFRYDIEGLPKKLFHHSSGNQRFPPLLRARALEYPFRHKNLYAINNNGARNAALEEGRSLAEWVMPWDGNCFLTKPAWDSILLAVESLQNKKYLITPMAKVKHNLDLLDSRFAPNPTGEPQIAFRRDAQERFDDLKRYGFNPKVELLRRLRVPGPWDNWPGVPWEQQQTNDAKEAGEFHFAGWVARLSYGISESKNVPSLIPLARINGIVRMLSSLDERVLREKFRQDDLVYYDEWVLAASKLAWKCGEIGVDAVINKLIGTAESLLKVGPYSVLDKTSISPSGDPHDYLNPPPYWWSDPGQPDTKAGMHDGKRLPENELYSPESGKYDRTRLQLMFDHTTMLALAWYFTADERYAEHASLMIRTWFLDAATRMNPHLKYAQIRLGEQDEQFGYGIIETKDLYYFLDAVRLVFRSRKLSESEQKQFKQWCREFLGWLLNSPQGKRILMAQNNQGTYYDLQVASLAAFLGDTQTLVQILRVSCMRAAQQFQMDGSQPEELKRTNSLHYSVFNLQGWFSLSKIARLANMDLWNTSTTDGGCPSRGLSWILSFREGKWPHQQMDEFDNGRLDLLRYLTRFEFTGANTEPSIVAKPRSIIQPLFHPYAGIQPFWSLGIN